MNALKPQRCPEHHWRLWLNDGVRLIGRACTGWGILFWAIFALRGWLMIQVPVLWGLALFLVLSPWVELAHVAVFREVFDGRVAMFDTLKAVAGAWRTHARLMLSMMRIRMLFVLPFLLLFMPMSHLRTDASAFEVLLASMQISSTVSFWPTIARMGGIVSLALTLVYHHGAPMDLAHELHRDAFRLNEGAFRRLLLLFSFMLGFGGAGPLVWLYPVFEMWVHATLTCASADIFDDGSRMKALARTSSKAPVVRARLATAVPAKG